MTEKTTTGRLIAAIGGIVLIVSLFLTWYKFEASANVGGFSSSSSTGISAWDAFGGIDLLLLLIGLLAIVPAALDIFDLEIELPVDMSFVALGAGAAGAALIVFRVIDKPGPDISYSAPGVEAGVALGFGLMVGLAACVAVAVGGFRQMSEGDSGSAPSYAAPPAGAPPMPPQGMPPQPPAPPAAPPQAPPPPPAAPPQAAPPQAPQIDPVSGQPYQPPQQTTSEPPPPPPPAG